MNKFEDKKPEPSRLVLVWFGDFTGFGLRSFTADGEMYDEHEFYDDSGEEPLLWSELPAPEGDK